MISILTQIENRKLAKIAENKVNLQKGLYRLLRMSTCVGEPFDSQHVIKRSSTCTGEAINSGGGCTTWQHLIKVIATLVSGRREHSKKKKQHFMTTSTLRELSLRFAD